MTTAYPLSEAIKMVDDPIDLMEAVKSLAESTLRNARKDGETIVGHTLRGSLDVTYANKVYKISTWAKWDYRLDQTVSGQNLYQGKKSGAIKALMNSYAIML